jgi:predicted 3-demethylubiquinone-9 3-methyltransferase (glyoxalase superfamily)
MSKITPHLWFDGKAEEAAKLYVSLLPDSHIDGVTTLPAESPSGPPGSVTVVDFTLAGQPYTAFDGGPFDEFNHAISFMIQCEDQAEIDRLSEKLSEGGTVEPCGWVKDRFGVSWQIAPRALADMMKDPDRARAKRVTEAMLKMKKIDIAALERAYEGKA